jgi:signal transduction histidine kinase
MPYGPSVGRTGLPPAIRPEVSGRDASHAHARGRDSSSWPDSGAAFPGSPARYEPGIADLVLGLRLLALAVVAGSGTLLPIGAGSRGRLILGILAGGTLGVAQHAAVRAGRRRIGEALILAHVFVWSWLVYVSGGQGSPLFVGYLLEIALAGAAFSRRGCALAATSALAAYLLGALAFDRPLDPGTVATVGGFIAVGTVLTWLMVAAIERLRERLDAYHGALRVRADTAGEELRLLGDYLSGALVGIDGLGRIASLNPAAAALLGVDREGSIGRAWQETIRADERGARAIAATLSEGTPQRGLRMALAGADGHGTVVEAELWVSPSPEGRRAHLLMREARGAPAGEDPLRRLGEAVACVAHQIRNSLQALQGLAGEIARGRAADARREETDRLLEVVRSLNALSADVLAMAGGARPPAEVVPLRELVASALVVANLPGDRVAIEVPPEQIGVRVHRGRLVHALVNLLDNAVRVSPRDEPVRVRIGRVNGRVTIEIADRGPGMPAGLAGADGPVLSDGGSGYGLLAVRRFLEGCSGGLSIESRDGGGTVCRITLPASAPAVGASPGA